MSTLRKFGWHLLATAAAVVVVFGVLAVGPLGTAEAAHVLTIAPSTASPGSVVSVTATGVGAGETVVFEVLSTSTATGTFVANGSTVVACTDAGTCDTSSVAGTVAVSLFVSNNSAAGAINISSSRSGYAGDIDTASLTVAAGAGTLASISVSGSSSIANAGGGNDYSVYASDASGNRVVVTGVTVTVTAKGTGTSVAGVCAILGAAGAINTSTCTLDTTSSTTAPAKVGVMENGSVGDKFTITAFKVVGGVPMVGSLEVTIAGSAASVTVDAADSQVGASQTVVVNVMDSTGNPVGPTSVTLAASEGVVACGSTMTSSGSLSCTYVAPASAQNVVITAIANPGATQVIASKTIAISGGAVTPPPTTGEGTFDRAVPNVGVNTAVWNGGTVEQLSAATAAAGGISVTVFVNGQATVLIPGAPAFVNAAFNAAFPDGTVPAGTIVLVVK